jgi:hypothetical protein
MRKFDPNLLKESRQGFTAAEFGMMLGKSKSWTYRMLYLGKLKAIQGLGALIIPRSELERLLSEKAIFSGRARKAKSSQAINKAGPAWSAKNDAAPVESGSGGALAARDQGHLRDAGTTPTT